MIGKTIQRGKKEWLDTGLKISPKLQAQVFMSLLYINLPAGTIMASLTQTRFGWFILGRLIMSGQGYNNMAVQVLIWGEMTLGIVKYVGALRTFLLEAT